VAEGYGVQQTEVDALAAMPGLLARMGRDVLDGYSTARSPGAEAQLDSMRE
jgi:hypothetical protein